MNRPYVAGNWKMNLDRRSCFELAEGLRDALRDESAVQLGVAVPYPYLELVAQTLSGGPVAVGAQDVCDRKNGAFTGEVSAEMLLDVGCRFALVGHSERRHVYGETDALCSAKLRRALEAGLDVVLCVGETLEERDGGRTETVVRKQLVAGLEGVDATSMVRVAIAYEPVWAIGTGRNATPQQASEVHVYLRGLLSGLYDDTTADAVRIQYGGSVKPANAADLMAAEGVDGALVGGASLKVEDFLPIVRAAAEAAAVGGAPERAE